MGSTSKVFFGFFSTINYFNDERILKALGKLNYSNCFVRIDDLASKHSLRASSKHSSNPYMRTITFNENGSPASPSPPLSIKGFPTLFYFIMD
jgi:hypothetical protein